MSPAAATPKSTEILRFRYFFVNFSRRYFSCSDAFQKNALVRCGFGFENSKEKETYFDKYDVVFINKRIYCNIGGK